MPLLFQRRIGLENRPIPSGSIRDLIREALAASGITGTDGKPLDFQPPRLPQALHHRRHPQRHATPHRPAHPRPRRHKHHNGLQELSGIASAGRETAGQQLT